jgi:hypothetical protein
MQELLCIPCIFLSLFVLSETFYWTPKLMKKYLKPRRTYFYIRHGQ